MGYVYYAFHKAFYCFLQMIALIRIPLFQDSVVLTFYQIVNIAINIAFLERMCINA